MHGNQTLNQPISARIPTPRWQPICKITTVFKLASFFVYLRLRSHRSIRYTVYGIRYTLFGIPYGCGHIGVDYSGIRCTFLRAREYLKSNIIISLYRITIGGECRKKSHRKKSHGKKVTDLGRKKSHRKKSHKNKNFFFLLYVRNGHYYFYYYYYN